MAVKIELRSATQCATELQLETLVDTGHQVYSTLRRFKQLFSNVFFFPKNTTVLTYYKSIKRANTYKLNSTNLTYPMND